MAGRWAALAEVRQRLERDRLAVAFCFGPLSPPVQRLTGDMVYLEKPLHMESVSGSPGPGGSSHKAWVVVSAAGSTAAEQGGQWVSLGKVFVVVVDYNHVVTAAFSEP